MNAIDAKFYIFKKITCWTEEEGDERDKLTDFIEKQEKENTELKEIIKKLRGKI